MKKILSLIISIFAFITISYSQGGALCLYVDGNGVVVCTSYNNSSVNSEGNCAESARQSNPACGLNMNAINVGAGSCASQIFGSPSRCLDNIYPHNITTSTTQATCESAGDRWCQSTYYGFFVGNSQCQTAICNYANGVLPVELIDFKGYIDNEDNNLIWNTASENNSDYYIIEYSNDGFNWSSIGQIPAAGNSTEIIGYRFVHKSPDLEINYYKLSQFDMNGDFVTYEPISIDNRKIKYEIVSITNMLGQLVDENYKGLTIIKYTDGSTKKVYF